MTPGAPRTAVLVTALAELLCRRCLAPAAPGDAETARRIVLELASVEEPPVVVAAAVGRVWAAYRSSPLDPELVVAALDTARVLLRTEIDESEHTLVSAALALMAVRGLGDQPAVDLVNAAVSARRVEQHDVGLFAADEALRRRDQLSPSHQALALLTKAVITRDPAVINEAYNLTEQLPLSDLAARSAEALRPSLHPAGGFALTATGEAVRQSDRPAAAASLAVEIGALRATADDDLLRGLHEALEAMAQAEIDVESARRGLMRAVAHLRRRQRYGQVPPVARAAIDIIADLLTLETSPAAANVLTELLEALADAGLSELVELAGDELSSVAQAQLSELAQRESLWPDLARCVAGLHGHPALLLRRQRMLSTGQISVLCLYVQPPDGLAIKKTMLTEEQSALVQRLALGDPDAIATTTEAAVDELVSSLLPARLAERARAGALEALVVVPDGPLWTVPWQAATLLRRTEVLTVPSLSVHARLPPMPALVRRVAAIVDYDAPGAELVVDALQEARSGGRLDVRFTGDVTADADLLLVFAHGGGTGLRFRTGSSAEPLDVLSLARASAPTALVAACWSAAAPPVSFPINLPVAMLLGGSSTVAGGLWPLPAVATAQIVARAVAELGDHGRLLTALANARSAAPDDVLARWGLAVHGAGPGSAAAL
jgi:hypothetical protein